MNFVPSVLLISGFPGSGKSTVTHALKQALPAFALLEKDRVKEALFDALDPEQKSEPGLSRRLSDMATEVLWSLAPSCPFLMLEANFRTKSPVERERFGGLPGRKLEVHCRCSAATAKHRFAARASSRHAAHTLRTLSSELLAEFEQPFALSPVIDLDTETPFQIAPLMVRLREHWPDLPEHTLYDSL